MTQTIISSQEGSANALAINRDNNQVVIGGRNVFKVFNIEDSEFVENCNLRVGKNLNLNFSCNDVAWNVIDDAVLATAATNGAVVVWNLNKPTRSKQDHVFNDHKRTVNKVCFKPSEPFLLLSGSQDGTMKLFDLRIKDVVRTFVSKSESVRDVQFSPHQFNLFASVSENGNVQIWDMRRTDKPSLQFTAHSGPIFACDWHAEMRWLATASRDKTIRIWDMEVKPSLEFTINTLASIGHIKWRPGRRFQVASCALVVDSNVNVWDIRRPFIPFAAFDQHKDVVTGVVWRGTHTFLSTSRDCCLVQHVFGDAKRPANNANPQAISINGMGDVLAATKICPPSRRSKSDQFLFAVSALQAYSLLEKTEAHAFVECACRYILNGKSLSEMCETNAAIARSVNRPHVALVWDTIKVLYSYSTNNEDHIFVKPDDLLLSEPKQTISKVVSSCDASEEKSLRGLDVSNIEDDDLDESELAHIHRPPDMQAQGDFFFGDGELDPLSVDQFEAASRLQFDWTVKAEAFVTRHEILEGAPPEPYGETIETAPVSDNISSSLTVPLLPSLPCFHFEELVVKALKHHADIGDVQTVVAVLAVLGERRRDLDIPLSTHTHWLMAYIDLLGRYRLFAQSAELIQIAWIPEVNQLSQQSTTIYTICGSCNKPLTRCGWLCDRCRATSVCSLCHQVVRGLMAWCQGCGHGGHFTHLSRWFAKNNQCPTGCGHLCEYG